MPYKTNSQLPPAVRRLPDAAQTAWREAFMSAMQDGKTEAECAAIAWAAVKGMQMSIAVPMTIGASADPQGWAWDVVIAAPGIALITDPQSGLPIYFSRQFLADNVGAFDGVPVFANHDRQGLGTVQALIGYIEQPKILADGQAGGIFRLLQSEEWARAKLKAAADAGKLSLLGMSVNLFATTGKEKAEGRQVVAAKKLIPGAPLSVDLVTFPAAGGRILRAVASVEPQVFEEEVETHAPQPGAQGASHMRERILSILASLRRLAAGDARVAGLETELAGENPNHDSILQRATEILAAVQIPQAQAGGAGVTPAEIADLRTQVTTLSTQITAAQQAQRVAESRLLLSTMLTDSRLPQPLQADINRRFAGQVVTAEQITAEIKAVRDAFAALANDPSRNTGGAVRVELGLDTGDKMQIALDKTLGVRCAWTENRDGQLIQMQRGAELPKDIPAFPSIKAAYIAYTGDTEVTGRPDRIQRISADWNNAGFASALASTLHRILLPEYAEVDFGVERLVIKGTASDFKPQPKVRVGYLGDIATVDPEAAAYAKIAAPTDEGASLSIIQKGNILPITRKMIKNDDIGLITRLIRYFGRAARRTHAQYITDFFVNNAACYDTKAWFHADHGNLGAVAMSFAEMLVVRTAFLNFTEKDSLKPLGLEPKFLMFPSALLSTALKINGAEYVANDLSDRSTVRFMFGQNEQKPENFIHNKLLTDTNDWYVLGDPQEAPYLEIDYLDGRTEPEIFLANDPLVGAVFTNDEIQVKLRHEYGGCVVDTRNVYKEVVAP